MYYVGEFVPKKHIASIPVIWTFKKNGKQFSYWPIRNVSQKVEKRTPPPMIQDSSSWDILEIKILLNKTMFATLKLAEVKVNRIIDALTASENESLDSSGDVKDATDISDSDEQPINVEEPIEADGVDGETCGVSVEGQIGGVGMERIMEAGYEREAIGGVEVEAAIFVVGVEKAIGGVEVEGAMEAGDERENIGAVDDEKPIGGLGVEGAMEAGGERKATGEVDVEGGIGGVDVEGAIGGVDVDGAIGGVDVEGAIGGVGVEETMEVDGDLVEWASILPIKGVPIWNKLMNNLSSETKLEELREIYRKIDEEDQKSFLNKLIHKTFKGEWFCENIAFCTYKEKINISETELLNRWIDTLNETCCKNLDKGEIRKIVVMHCTRYRNTWGKSKNKAKNPKK